MIQSKKKHKSDKPAKPYDDFPLFAHATKRWAKKIRGKLHYFGPWSDPEAALAKYLDQRDDLHAGRTPRRVSAGVTVADVANAFLNHKRAKMEAGELSPLTWADYKDATDWLVRAFTKDRLVSDIRGGDFIQLRTRLAQKLGLHRRAKIIQYVRSVFKYAFEAELIDKPVRFGPDFKRPSKKDMRIDRAKQGAKLFTRLELRAMLDKAGVQLKAMLLLGINAGYGNSDCAKLATEALDLDRGIIDFARPKTGVPRRCALWPETVEALRQAIDKRPEPKKEQHAGLVFVTKYGLAWGKETADNPITKETRKLLDSLGINGHRNFYTLRHTFRTVADESKDQPAVDFVMGHESPHMSSHYRETISDERLRAVSDYVRTWLFGAVGAKESERIPSLDHFQATFTAVFDLLDRQGGSHNFVSLAALRPALAAFDRAAFDAGLLKLRRAGHFTLSAAEGRHGISTEEQEAGIREEGALLLFVSRAN